MAVKMCKRVSSNTTEVRGVPSSPEVFDHFVTHQLQFTEQRAVRPKTWCGEGGWGTTNDSGRAAVLGGTGSVFGEGSNGAPRKRHGSVDV